MVGVGNVLFGLPTVVAGGCPNFTRHILGGKIHKEITENACTCFVMLKHLLNGCEIDWKWFQRKERNRSRQTVVDISVCSSRQGLHISLSCLNLCCTPPHFHHRNVENILLQSWHTHTHTHTHTMGFGSQKYSQKCAVWPPANVDGNIRPSTCQCQNVLTFSWWLVLISHPAYSPRTLYVQFKRLNWLWNPKQPNTPSKRKSILDCDTVLET